MCGPHVERDGLCADSCDDLGDESDSSDSNGECGSDDVHLKGGRASSYEANSPDYFV